MNWTLFGWIAGVAAVPVAIDLAIMWGSRRTMERIRVESLSNTNRDSIPRDPNASAVSVVAGQTPFKATDTNAVIETAEPGSNAVIRVSR
jgi:hypothetical protein